MKTNKKRNNKKGVIAIGAVVSMICVVLFIVVGIKVVEPMSRIGDKLAAEKCNTLFEAKTGIVDGAIAGMDAFIAGVPDMGKEALYLGPASALVLELSGGNVDDLLEKKSESIVEQARMNMWKSLPEICGTIRTSCTGSVREVSSCLHDKMRWTYYAFSGGIGIPYGTKIDLFEVDVTVTEPSEIHFYAGDGKCENMLEGLRQTSLSAVDADVAPLEGMPFGVWCKLITHAVTVDTIALSSLMECYEQPNGPADFNCKCFFHPGKEPQYSLSQGFPIMALAGNNEYPGFAGYFGCGLTQPEEVPYWFSHGWINWLPKCHWKQLSALPGYAGEPCTLRIGMKVQDAIPPEVEIQTKTSLKTFVGVPYGAETRISWWIKEGSSASGFQFVYIT